MAELSPQARKDLDAVLHGPPLAPGATGELRALPDPTWRDLTALALRRLGLRTGDVGALLGSNGLGPSNTYGMGVADFSPLGTAFAVDEAWRAAHDGDWLTAGIAAASTAPIGKAAKAVKAIGAEAAQGAKRLFAPTTAKGTGATLGATTERPQFDLPRYQSPKGTSARVRDLFANESIKSTMVKHIKDGLALGAKDWLNTEPIRQRFVTELGEELGNKAFDDWVNMTAAASALSKVPQQIRIGSYFYHLLKSGRGLPGPDDIVPWPYGHVAQKLHRKLAQLAVDGKWDPLKNPKIASHAENLRGNYETVAVDSRSFRILTMMTQDPRFLKKEYREKLEKKELTMEEALQNPSYWQSRPKKNEYAAIEKFYKDVANELGIRPADAQTAAYLKFGQMTGHKADHLMPFIQQLEARIVLTAKKRKMKEEEVLTKFIQGKMPLLAFGGGAVLNLGDLDEATLGAVIGRYSAPDSEAEQRTY